MNDRRRLERFFLKLPAEVEVLIKGKKRIQNLVTFNISADGAYFHTREPLAEDTPVRVTVTMGNQIVRKLTGLQSLIKLSGKVVRTDSAGMAIGFKEKYKIERLIGS
ncbi:MAG: PilZ domain-containing protein [Deltaproteobacteria bacterium]|nr:MAG: PilZ domain-containing protein [Deltaproteobacteria bacterium]